MLLSKDVCFIYVVGGDDRHYLNLNNSIKTVRSIYPDANILIGDFDSKIKPQDLHAEVIDLSHIKIDKNKTYKHIIWQYKYYVSQMTKSRYNLYLDTDTVLVNNLNNLIQDSSGKFLIAKHFWIPDIKSFKSKAETGEETSLYLKRLGLTDDSADFCAAGVFFFEKTKANISILKDTFKIHQEIYANQDYILGIYDEPILNSVLQKNINNVIYYNGSINHCCMQNMPIALKDGVLCGKNDFDNDYKPITCLHCDPYRRDPTNGFTEPIKSLIFNLFNKK
jgi:hypothetical protein